MKTGGETQQEQRRREIHRDGGRERPREPPPDPPPPHRKRQREGGSGAELEKGGQGDHETFPPPRSAPHSEKGGLPRRSQPSPGLRPGTGGAPTGQRSPSGQCPVITPSSHLLGDRPPLGPSLRRRWVHVGSPEVPGVARAVSLPIGLNINTQPARGRRLPEGSSAAARPPFMVITYIFAC